MQSRNDHTPCLEPCCYEEYQNLKARSPQRVSPRPSCSAHLLGFDKRSGVSPHTSLLASRLRIAWGLMFLPRQLICTELWNVSECSQNKTKWYSCA